jgi:cadherin EGF LAG seven-pass G-type receptor 1
LFQVGTTVLVVAASDGDVGQNAQITYSLGTADSSATPEFTINPQTGAIITTKTLDRETVGGYLLTVTARDGGIPPLSDTTDVEIIVSDVNDNAPEFRKPSYIGSVPEDALVGTSVVQISAIDADMGLNGRIRYALAAENSDDGSFVVDPTSGVIRTAKVLDRESVAVYDLIAYAIDRGSPSLSGSVEIKVRVEDVNDSPPAFDSDKIVMYIAENSPVGSTVGEIHARDPDEGPNAMVQYSIIGKSHNKHSKVSSFQAQSIMAQDFLFFCTVCVYIVKAVIIRFSFSYYSYSSSIFLELWLCL